MFDFIFFLDAHLFIYNIAIVFILLIIYMRSTHFIKLVNVFNDYLYIIIYIT